MQKFRKTIQRIIAVVLAVCLSASYLPMEVLAEMMTPWEYRKLEDGTAALTRYTGSTSGEIAVPAKIGSLWVSRIEDGTFARVTGANISIPATVYDIGENAFPSSVTLSGYNGSAAMRYAAEHNLTYQNKSRFQFYSSVLDLSDLESGTWVLGPDGVSLPGAYGAILEEGSLVYLPAYADMPDGSGFQLTNIHSDGSMVTADFEVLNFFDVVQEYRLENQALTLDWSQAVLEDGVSLSPRRARGLLNEASLNIKKEFGALSVSGSIKLAITPHVTGLFDWEGPHDIKADVDISGTAALTFEGAYDKTTPDAFKRIPSDRSRQLLLAKIVLPAYQNGVFGGNLKFFVYASFSGSVSIETEFHWDPTLTYTPEQGLAYHQGASNAGLSPVGAAFEANAALTLSPTLEFFVGFSIPTWMQKYAKMNPNFRFLEVYLDLAFKAGIKSSKSFGCFDLNGAVTVCLGARAGFLSDMELPKDVSAVVSLANLSGNLKENKLTVELKSPEWTLWSTSKHWEKLNSRWQDECEEDMVTVNWYVGDSLWESARILRGDPLPNCAEPPSMDGLIFRGWVGFDGNPIPPSCPVLENLQLRAYFGTIYEAMEYETPAPVKPLNAQPSSWYPQKGYVLPVKYYYENGQLFVNTSYWDDQYGLGYDVGSEFPTFEAAVSYAASLGYDARVSIDYADAKGMDVYIPYTIGGQKVVAVQNISECRSITVAEGYKELPNGADSGAYYLPDSLELLPYYYFGGRNHLLLSDIPKSLIVTYSVFPEMGSMTGLSFRERESVTVPGSVELIEDNTFADCARLKSVVLSEGVKHINANAFRNCTNLTEISLPSTLEWIEEGVFENCASLESIVLPEGIGYIPKRAFAGCTNLKEVILPEALVEIGTSAFQDCVNLTQITISCPFSSYALIGSGVTQVTLKNIEFGTIENWSVKELSIREDNGQNGHYKIFNCPDLTTIYYYPETIRYIEEWHGIISDLNIHNCPKLSAIYVHKGSQAEDLIAEIYPNLHIMYLEGGERPQDYLVHFTTGIPQSIPDIIVTAGEKIEMPQSPVYEGMTFTGWYTDEKRTHLFDPENTMMPDHMLELFAGWKENDPEFQAGEQGKLNGIRYSSAVLVIPGNSGGKAITAIGANAIPDNVRELTIPSTITQIDTDAFTNALSLEKITVASGNTSFKSVDGVLYSKSGTLLCYPAARKAESFTVAAGTTAIATHAFQCAYNLSSVSLPSTVKRIESQAFSGCPELSWLEFQADVQSIAPDALTTCESPIIQCEANAPVLASWAKTNSLSMNLRFILYWNDKKLLYVLGMHSGESLPMPEGANDSDRTIIGWAYDAAGTKLVDMENDLMPNRNLNLYAVFGTSYSYELQKNGGAVLTRYRGGSNMPFVPDTVDGHPVAAIAEGTYGNIVALKASASNTIARQYAAAHGLQLITVTATQKVDNNWEWKDEFIRITSSSDQASCGTLRILSYNDQMPTDWDSAYTVTAKTDLPNSQVTVRRNGNAFTFYVPTTGAESFHLTVRVHKNELSSTSSSQYADLVITKQFWVEGTIDDLTKALWSWEWDAASTLEAGYSTRIGQLKNVCFDGVSLSADEGYTISGTTNTNAYFQASSVKDQPGATDLYLTNTYSLTDILGEITIRCNNSSVNGSQNYRDLVLYAIIQDGKVQLSAEKPTVFYEYNLMNEVTAGNSVWLGNLYSICCADRYLSSGTDYTVTAAFDQPGLNVVVDCSPEFTNGVNFYLTGSANTCDAVLKIRIQVKGEKAVEFSKPIHIYGRAASGDWTWQPTLYTDVSTGSGVWLGLLYGITYNGDMLSNDCYTVDVQADRPGVTVSIDNQSGAPYGVNFNMSGAKATGSVTLTFTIHRTDLSCPDLVFTHTLRTVAPQDAVAPSVRNPDTSPIYVPLGQQIALPKVELVGGNPNNSNWELYVMGSTSDGAVASCWASDSVPYISGQSRGAVMLTLYARSCFEDGYNLPLYSRPIYVDCTPVDVDSIQNWLVLPKQLKEIQDEAFCGTQAEAVRIPDQCTRVGSRAFADCPNLIYVEIPAGIELAEDAFADCNAVIMRR